MTSGRLEDRRRLLAYARDLLNSDYAGHRLTFQLFAQSPPFAHLLAVYCNFDFAEPMRIVRSRQGCQSGSTGRPQFGKMESRQPIPHERCLRRPRVPQVARTALPPVTFTPPRTT